MKEAKNENPGTLASALLAAQQGIAGVVRDSTVDFGRKYTYTSAEEMIRETRAALHRANLVVYRSGWELAADGMTVVSSMTVSHPPSGQSVVHSVPWVVVVEKGRPVDKALAGALTTSLGYFLRDLLLLPREEEGEMDRRNDSDARRQPDVGYRQKPKTDPVEKLNKAVAVPREPSRIVGVLQQISSNKVGEVVYPILRIKTDTGILEVVANPSSWSLEALGALVNKGVLAQIAPRPGRLSTLVAIEQTELTKEEMNDDFV